MNNYDKGMELSKQKRFAEAYRCFSDGAATDPRCMRQQALCLLNGRGILRDSGAGVDLLWQAAGNGDADSYFHLSNLHYMGHAMPQNPEEGMRLLQRAVELGSAPARLRLATMIVKGEAAGTDEDALDMLRKAAEQGMPEALNMLGVLYVEGRLVPRDGVEAQRLFCKAHDMGLAEATFNLSMTYADGVAGNADIVESTRLLQQSAERGYVKAFHMLGMRYLQGQGVSRDTAKAREWIYKSATAGNPEGENMYGNMLMQGQGVPRDPASARLWFEKAAAKGHAGALNNLGVCMLDGTGGQRDEQQAVRLFGEAREKGNRDGSFNLGLCMAAGRGIARDEAKSFELFREAMQRGHVSAPAYVGYSLVRGVGVPSDPQEGIRILLDAVKKGERTAMFHYAQCLLNGYGVAQNHDLGMDYLNRAAGLGYEPARQELNRRLSLAKAEAQSMDPLLQTAESAPKTYGSLADMRIAADSGDSEAMVRLGDAYRTGEGVAADDAMACVWYERASGRGNLMADYALACMLWAGKGTPINQNRALKLWQQCALLGHVESQYQLALAAKEGKQDERPDPESCVQWATKAAQKGHKEACLLLADCYQTGFGVKPNTIKADYWRKLAQQA